MFKKYTHCPKIFFNLRETIAVAEFLKPFHNIVNKL
jgi:hypothetical protein